MLKCISYPTLLLSIILASICGCSSSGIDVETVPVSGKVTYKGGPLPDVTLIFTPLKGGRTGRANVGTDGTFGSATSFVKGDGLIVGEHNVTVVANNEATDEDEGSYDEEPESQEYSNITVTIKSGDSKPLDIAL
jgi:hypothetical protein